LWNISILHFIPKEIVSLIGSYSIHASLTLKPAKKNLGSLCLHNACINGDIKQNNFIPLLKTTSRLKVCPLGYLEMNCVTTKAYLI